MEIDIYKTIESPSEGIYKEKGSKFIAYAYPVYSEEEIKSHLDILKKEYYDARHHCFAYMLGEERKVFRANDDGEPSSSAGKPILGQINSNDLTNIFIVVIRYFGGTKLGVSGLINAYKTAAADAIENANIIEKTVNHVYRITFDYLVMNDVMKILKEDKPEQIGQNFDMMCNIDISMRKNEIGKVIDKLNKISSVKTEHLRTV